ncbi:putative membrane protein [Novosphingobium chloroacetimidivorans]|uniref:Putative membrane protein n=1 Tax=Novosphingobium chloroacetimidivorans TaxID=1428314 RepID=A0A7W7KCT7_9SPHN|nr:SRPBCC family protein [Novosphingobium chloroacetimidivorans]MBB4860175.1 putative membrane protein [Novosphingobium chloroacetimidivorans]
MEDAKKGLGVAGLAGLMLAAGAGAYLSTRKDKRHTSPDDAPGHTARRGFGAYDVIGRTVTIARPREELYAFWRDFSNLATFMENIVSVKPTGDNGRAVWTILAPAGRTVEVETEIVSEQPGELIAWRSVPGSQIDTEGRVTFADAPGERGTRVGVRVAYKPPAGELGRVVAKLFMREPEIQARHDLKRFKMLMEAGEIATSARRKDQTRAAKQEQSPAYKNEETA